MTIWHIGLNPGGASGQQYGYCNFNGTNCTGVTIGSLPSILSTDQVYFYLYNFANSTMPTLGGTNNTAWITSSPMNAPTGMTPFRSFNVLQNVTPQAMNQQHSAIFSANYNNSQAWCWNLGLGVPINPGMNGNNPNQWTFNVNFGFNGSSFDPEMVVTSGGN